MTDDSTWHPVTEDDLFGTWSDSHDYGFGRIVDCEWTLSKDRTFVWRELRFTGRRDEFEFPGRSGTWTWNGSHLLIQIVSNDRPDRVPRSEAHLQVHKRPATTFRADDAKAIQLKFESVFVDDHATTKECEITCFLVRTLPGDAERNHEQHRSRIKAASASNPTIDKLRALLAKEIPKMASRAAQAEPICCARIVYYDTHAPATNYAPQLVLIAESVKKRVCDEVDAKDVADEFWHPTLGILGNLPTAGVYVIDLSTNPEIAAVGQEVFAQLERAENETMLMLRAALRKVSLTLHMVPWPGVKRTPDFVVFPADGSNHFAGEYLQDMIDSIPQNRLKLLVDQGLFETP